MHSKPKNKLFVFLNVVLIVLFIGILSYIYFSQINVFWQLTTEKITIRTEEHGKTLSLWFEPRIKLVDMIYDDLIHFNLTEKDELGAYFTMITAVNHDVMATYVATEDKNVVFNDELESPEGFDPTVRGWYLLAMENAGKTVVSEPYIDILTGELVITVTKAVQLSNGLNGAIGIDFDLSAVTSFVNNVNSYENGTAFLLSNEGNVVTHANALFLPVNVDGSAVFTRYADIPAYDIVVIEVDSEYVSLERLVRDGEPQFVSTITIENVGWVYGIKIPVSDFDTSLTMIATPLIIAIIIGFGVFAGGIIIYFLHVKSLLNAAAIQEEMAQEIAQQMKTIEQLGLIDPLTDIPNRRDFDNRIIEEWQRSAREKYPLSICIIDIDFFKNLNDTHGHQFGDEILKEVALIIKSSIRRATDYVARWGGEEFAVLLPHTDAINARQMAEFIRRNVEDADFPEPPDNTRISLTISIGVATAIPTDENSVEEFFERADRALYVAKDTGRNQVCF